MSVDGGSAEWFATIGEHWANFLERDIPENAPDVQVMSMKQAFAAGAISGVQLSIKATRDGQNIMEHVRDIQRMIKPDALLAARGRG